MSEQGTMDAAEFLSPPTGDSETDARIAKEAAPPKPAPAPKVADNDTGAAPADTDDEASFVGADDPQDEVEAEQGDEAGDGETDDEDAKADEFEEIEVGGKKHKLPKELKPLLMMQQDYTRKTQEVAETRRALESQAEQVKARDAAIAQQAELLPKVAKHLADISNIDAALQNFAAVDWAALDQEDPVEAGRLYRQQQQLKELRGAALAAVKKAEVDFYQDRKAAVEAQQREAREAHAKRQAEAAATFQAKFKLPDDTIKKVFEYAREQGGYDAKELADLADHRPLTTLYKSYLWDQHVAKQRSAAKAKAPAPEPVKPLERTPKGTTAPASRGLDDRLSPEEWARRRNEQLRGRR